MPTKATPAGIERVHETECYPVNCPARRSPRLRWWLGLVALASVLTLSSCASSQPPSRLQPDLKIPHVAKVPGIEALEQRVGSRSLLMTTYRTAAAPRSAHVLFQLLGGAVYDVSLDGSGLRQVSTRCGIPVKVTPDGRWLVCQNDAGVALHDLLSQSQTGDRQVLNNTGDLRFGTPTWTPDGHHLAMVTGQAGGCAIAIYVADAGYSTLTLSALLAFPEFIMSGPSGPLCYVSELGWSPDGDWLSFVGGPGYHVNVLAVPSIVRTVLQSSTPPITPVTVAIQKQSLLAVGSTYPTSKPVWSLAADTLTLAGSQGWSIDDVNVQSRQKVVVLTQRVGAILSLSWTPDGRHLVFVLQAPNGDYQPPPAQIYVYTPPGE